MNDTWKTIAVILLGVIAGATVPSLLHGKRLDDMNVKLHNIEKRVVRIETIVEKDSRTAGK